MALIDYFGEWLKVFNTKEFNKIIYTLNSMYKHNNMCPTNYSDVFKAFRLCPYESVKLIFLAQDPYPQKDVATGLCFANKQETKEDVYSPSLKIIKDACIDLHYSNNSINFDPSLEDWSRQGILLLNSALTTEVNKIGLHTMMWRPFISSFLRNFSTLNPGIIYVLFGNQAKTFKPYIKNSKIITTEQPAYYARNNIDMPSNIFYRINTLMELQYNTRIKWFKTINDYE